jgi:hypothetical protein
LSVAGTESLVTSADDIDDSIAKAAINAFCCTSCLFSAALSRSKAANFASIVGAKAATFSSIVGEADPSSEGDPSALDPSIPDMVSLCLGSLMSVYSSGDLLASFQRFDLRHRLVEE